MSAASPRISVIQPGARLHYAAPAAFAHAGLLQKLYTDLHAEHAWLRLVDDMLPASAKPRAVRRLLGRRLPPGLPSHLVRDRPIETMARALGGMAGLGAIPGGVTTGLLADLERDVRPGDIVYTVLINEDVEAMARLKERGVTIVHECIVSPAIGLTLAEEYRLHGIVEGAPDIAEVERGRARDSQKYALADLILVPSSFAGRGVEALAPAGASIVTVPYGFDLSPFSHPATPDPGNVLCVGSVGLVKGNPYLAAAARALGSEFSIRVAGPIAPQFKDLAILEGPIYLGQVPRSDVVAEFAKADVFALPTICDSFGIVLVEALAMGVPVVTTSNCGDIVRDGIDGFIVPPRDPAALAQAIRRIVGDRNLRAQMSANAKVRAQEFSQDAYEHRLIAAIRPLWEG